MTTYLCTSTTRCHLSLRQKEWQKTGIQPQPEVGEMLRWNWDTPLIISPHSPTRLYIGAQKLFRSDDRGDTWKAISGDVSRQIDRNKLPVMGKVWVLRNNIFLLT
ncbi:MAG: hypothetical protein ACOVSW_14925 [Candidatus Kapaibacteriota bacterium]